MTQRPDIILAGDHVAFDNKMTFGKHIGYAVNGDQSVGFAALQANGPAGAMIFE